KGSLAPPAVGTCVVAAFAEPNSGSGQTFSTSLTAVMTSSKTGSSMGSSQKRRNRKRDILFSELGSWKSQFREVFDAIFIEKGDRPAHEANIFKSSQDYSNVIGVQPVRETGVSKSTSRANSKYSGGPSSVKTTSNSGFNIKVFRKKHYRKQVEDLFLPVDANIISVCNGIPGILQTGYLNSAASKSQNTRNPQNDSCTLNSGGKSDQKENDQSVQSTKPKDQDDDGDKDKKKERKQGERVNSGGASDDEGEEDDDEDEEEDWNEGYRYWKERRDWWVSSSADTSQTSDVSFTSNSLSMSKKKSHPVRQISEEAYPRIYHLLVNEGRRLKEPINLSDATKILVSGWRSTGQWPPQPGPPDPLIGSRRKLLRPSTAI
ncbi:hypothetical protein V1511DRAFT_458512, partial [Dipodascopsis uninucleata]